ncbi:MAG: right-handed parallel beta-helix repeat-containing protein [Elusimicrobia bacterium]|nr:right-handed parallel beta-helix repeat-containing protein [Elusimicrobiota bacterium]
MSAAPPLPGYLEDVWMQVFALLAVASGLFVAADHFAARAPAAPAPLAAAAQAGAATPAAGAPLAGPLLVDPRGAKGSLTTIAAAVQAAKEGDTIVLKPGVYNESVSVSKSLILSGSANTNDQVQWTSAESRTLTVAGGRVFLKGLTLTNTGGSEASAAEVLQGSLVLEQAKVQAAGMAVSVRDAALEATDVVLQGRTAVSILGRSRASLLRATVTGGWTGLWVEGMSDVRVESSQLKGAQNSGVEAGRFAKVRMTEVSLAGSGQAAVQARGGADVRIERSRVSDNRGCGLSVENATATIERVRFEREPRPRGAGDQAGPREGRDPARLRQHGPDDSGEELN